MSDIEGLSAGAAAVLDAPSSEGAALLGAGIAKDEAISQVEATISNPLEGEEGEELSGQALLDELARDPVSLDENDPLYKLFGNDVVMSNVTDSVNVRASAGEDAEIVGKLYHNCGAKLLDQVNGWSEIQSGKVQGWVSSDYLIFGQEAVDMARQVGSLMGTVTTQTLRIRESADENSAVYGLLAEGDKIQIISEEGDWAKVSYSDDSEGYISKAYVTTQYEIDEGETIEEIRIREEKEAARKKAEEEAAKKAAAEAKKKKQSANRTTSTGKVNNGAVAAAADDTTLLAALIQCECGNEIYEGKVAVGAVVVNRARGRYGSIYNAIYAPGQFGPAASGKVAAVLAVGPRADCIKAAQEAISGVSNVGSATHFRNIRSGYSGIVIGNHVFW